MEYFNSIDGKNILFLKNGTFKELTINDEQIIEHLLEIISSNYPNASNRLNERYCINFKNNKPLMASKLENFKKARRFIRCNFLVSDNIPDVSEDGIINIENVICPLKGGDCPDEGVICNPVKSTILSSREHEIVLLICDGLQDHEIADKLFLSTFTVENHRKNILRKLNLHSKEQIIIWAYNNGLRK